MSKQLAVCWALCATTVVAAPDLIPTRLEVLGTRTPCPGPLPASAHPYANFVEAAWTNTCPGAEFIEVTFDPRTSLEDQFDYLLVTDGSGANVPGSPFTGTQLAGRSIVIDGDTVILRLETDGAITDWGFAVAALSALSADPAPSLVAGQDVNIYWEVKNQGSEAVTNLWWDTLFMSPTGLWTNGVGLHYHEGQPPLLPNESYGHRLARPLRDDFAGGQYLIFRTDDGNKVTESNEANNEVVLPVQIDTTDFAIGQLIAPINAAPHEQITVSWTVTNLSPYTAWGHWHDQIQVSNATHSFGFGAAGPLAAGASYSVTQQVTLYAANAGTNLLHVEANASGRAEVFRDNNVATAPIVVTPPDLIALRAEAPSVAFPREWVFARLVISNAGPVTAYPHWYDVAYVSPTNRLGPEAVRVAHSSQFAPSFGPGEVYWQHFQFTVGAQCSGDCYLLLVADGMTNLFDPAFENNVIALPLRIEISDLAAISFNTSHLTAAPNELIDLNWRVETRGTDLARGPWYDVVELSTEPTGSNSFMTVAFSWVQEDFPPGTNYFRSVTGRVPPVTPGDYYLVFKADRHEYLPESNETNNILSIPITISGVDLAAESISGPAEISVREPFTVSWTVRNFGPSTAYPPWHDTILISSVSNIFDHRYFLGSFPATNAIAAGATHTRTQTVQTVGLPEGDYSLVLHSDYQFYPINTNSNNRTAVPIRVLGIDLAAAGLTAPSAGPLQNNVSVSLLISNASPRTAYPSWDHYFYLSPTNRWVPAARQIGWARSDTQLVAGATAMIHAELQLNTPGFAGDQYLVAVIEPHAVSDPNRSNNEIAAPFHVQAPDLVSDFFAAALPYTNCVPQFPESPHPVRGPIDQTWTNSCPGADSLSITFDYSMESSGGLVHITDDASNPVAGSPFYTSGLAGATITVPGDTVRIRLVWEQTWDIFGFAITQMVGFRSADTLAAAPQQPIEFQWRIRNSGDGPTASEWSDSVVVKKSRYSSWEEQEIVKVWRPNPLAPAESYSRVQSARLPSLKPGHHELELRADADLEIDEVSESNNSRSLTLEITTPDLVAVDLTAPSTVDGQGTFEVSWRTGNAGPVVAFPNWEDQIYVSPTNRVTAEARELWFETRYFPLIPGNHYSATQTVTLPPLPEGNYYLIVKVDNHNVLFDPAPENNELAIPITIRIPDLTSAQFSGFTRGPACAGPYPELEAPFPQNEEFWWTNSCFGAAALSVRFSFPNHYSAGDRVTVFDGEGDEIGISGLDSSFYYYVPGDTVIIRLQTDDLANDYGFAVTSITPFFSQTLPVLAPQAEVELMWVVQNLGPGGTTASWVDKIYFSQNATLDESDQTLGHAMGGNSLGFGQRLAPGGEYVGVLKLWMPSRPSGNYFLIFETDGSHQLEEANEGNNLTVLAVQLQTADLHAMTLSATNPASARESIRVSWSVRNDGAASAWPVWDDHVYLSSSPAWDQTATYLRTFSRTAALAPGQTYSVTGQVNLPRVGAGNYHLILRADGGNKLADPNLANNSRSTPISILAPDLIPLSLRGLKAVASCPGPYPESPAPPAPANTILRWTNDCAGASNLQVTFAFDSYVWQFLSILDGNRDHIPGSPFTGWIGQGPYFVPGDRVILELSTGPSPSFTTFSVTDISSVVETTNIIAAPQSRLDVEWTVQNIGSGVATPRVADGLTLSIDLMSDPGDRFLNFRSITEPVAPGARYTQRSFVNFETAPAGDYYLLLKTDTFDEHLELDETNNTFFIPVTITPPADLAPVAFRVPASITSSHARPVIEVSWTVTNRGVAATPERWTDTIYLSGDPTDSGTEIARLGHSGSLLPGTTYTATQTVALQTPVSGRYYLFLKVDDYASVFEGDEDNNVLAATIDVNLVLPDLVVASVVVPPLLVSSREYPFLQVDWVVRNQGAGAAEGPWSDSVWINGEYHTSVYRNGRLLPGESHTNSAGVYLTRPTNGVYALTAWSDKPDDVNTILETDETNNSRTVWFEFVRSPQELVLVGEEGTVPLWWASTSAVSLLTFDLHIPGDKLYSIFGSAEVPELWYAHLSPADQDLYFGRIEALPGENLSGTREIARIYFETFPGQPSAFAPLWVSNLVARTAEGLVVPNVSLRAGRAVIIGDEPLLEATPLAGGQYSLTLYGLPGSNVVVEAQSSLTGTTWELIWQGSFTNRFQQLGPFSVADRSRFYRARY